MLKKLLLLITSIFIIFNILVYMSFYSIFVGKAPDEYKSARVYLLNAHFISFYESFPIKLNLISYDNPILLPIRKIKVYFQKEGIEKLPKKESERAVWYGITEFLPLYKDLINRKSRRLYFKYKTKFVKSIYKELDKNMMLLSNYNFKDTDNHRIKNRIVPLFYKYYEIYTTNFLDYSGKLNHADKKNYLRN